MDETKIMLACEDGTVVSFLSFCLSVDICCIKLLFAFFRCFTM